MFGHCDTDVNLTALNLAEHFIQNFIVSQRQDHFAWLSWCHYWTLSDVTAKLDVSAELDVTAELFQATCLFESNPKPLFLSGSLSFGRANCVKLFLRMNVDSAGMSEFCYA